MCLNIGEIGARALGIGSALGGLRLTARLNWGGVTLRLSAVPVLKYPAIPAVFAGFLVLRLALPWLLLLHAFSDFRNEQLRYVNFFLGSVRLGPLLRINHKQLSCSKVTMLCVSTLPDRLVEDAISELSMISAAFRWQVGGAVSLSKMSDNESSCSSVAISQDLCIHARNSIHDCGKLSL